MTPIRKISLIVVAGILVGTLAFLHLNNRHVVDDLMRESEICHKNYGPRFPACVTIDAKLRRRRQQYF